MGVEFLTADWKNLVMVNFQIDPAILQPYVPLGTELDDWNGTCHISLVAFQFLDTKVMGVTIPFHRNFEEINLRFYVRCRAQNEWRRGVVFIKEVVPKRAIAFVARWLYNENYHAMPTGSTIQKPQNGSPGTIEYRWTQRELFSVSVLYEGEPMFPDSNSIEEFISEHYWGYCSQRSGGTMEYKVEHPQWKLWKPESFSMNGSMGAFYGDDFAAVLSNKPQSVFLANGSAVSVHKGQRIHT